MHLTKSKTPTHVGPIQVTLTKTDPKKFKYTLMVVADDKTIEKKDKTADEPVQFYIKGATRPYEIVVFDVTKDKVNGYLSTPKDMGSAPPGSAVVQPRRTSTLQSRHDARLKAGAQKRSACSCRIELFSLSSVNFE